MTQLPNLQELEPVIEANVLAYAKTQGVPIDKCIANRTVEMWCQMWPDSTAGAAHSKSEIQDKVMTEGYVTLFAYKFYNPEDQSAREAYSFTYGSDPENGFVAMKDEMDLAFYEDWKNHNVLALWQVIEKYQ